jgi:tetraacyldisaccharide 4'-kinase
VGEPPRGALHRLQAAWLSRGPLAVLLLPVALLYGALSSIRGALFATGLLRTHHLPVPVIVVGNLIAGGAGKTPTVIAIVSLLRRRGFTPGIVSRGYGGSGEGLVDVQADTPATRCGDEPLLLRLRTGVPVMVGQDRVAAGQALLHAHPTVNVIVSDDGLQHRRLGRQVQVLVFDERGAGNGWWLPAGPLRERLPRAVPPRTLVLYNADAASTPLPGHLASRSLAGVVALSDWWTGGAPSTAALAALKGRRVVAAAGLARPERFFGMLRDAGLKIEPLALPDHHDYAALPWPAHTEDVVLTEKDAVKLKPGRIGSTRVWVAALDFAPGAAFEDALVALLPSPADRPPENSHGSPTA